MSQLTASNAAASGHQGAQGSMAFYSVAQPAPISLAHCFPMIRGRGFPSCYFALTGALATAAAESEGAAAATPSALSTPTGTTIAPAKFLVSLAINREAFWRALQENDPGDIAIEFATYGCAVYLMNDSTVGLGKKFTTVTATGGNTGATKTLEGALSAAETVRVNCNDANLVVSDIMDGKGQRNLQTDMSTNASAVYSNPAIANVIKQVLSDPKAMQADPDNGFWFTPDGKTALFVEPGYSSLNQVSGDRVGCALISPTKVLKGLPGLTFASRMQGGAREISPAFAIAVDPPAAYDPLVDTSPVKALIAPTPSGPVALMVRAYSGVDYRVYDARGMGAVALVHDNSACQDLYLA